MSKQDKLDAAASAILDAITTRATQEKLNPKNVKHLASAYALVVGASGKANPKD